jgi:hypothetical protein
MALPKTSSAKSGAEKQIPALSNVGYFSDYYLAHRLDSGLAGLYAAWDTAEKVGNPTARTQMRKLSRALGRHRATAAATAPGDDALDADRLDVGVLAPDAVAALLALNDAVLEALGWLPERGVDIKLASGEKTITVTAAHRCDIPTGLLLLALDTVFATDPAAVVATKDAPAGRLLNPVLVGDAPSGRTALEAAQLIFTSDEPPSYLLFVSGGAITLLDRDRWGEGVSLGADLDDAVGRGDVKPKGELAAIAALFSAVAINPGDEAQSVLTGLLERAATESAGVSKDLRHGMRRSVELLANAVVDDMRYRQKGAWTTIDPADLTRQSLRYLYRIIVLLFAEARPELGILPSDDPDYQAGYSLARLRDTVLVQLHSDTARNARHIQHSLNRLFSLVNEGHASDRALGTDDARELAFPGLRSRLFGRDGCPLVDGAHLKDEVLQEVLGHLCFSRERAGKPRRPVSYATLGINQLGAVYEGLMAYSGFLAKEPLLEIDKDGDPDNGSWVIPTHRAAEFPDDVFLTEEKLDGSTGRVSYAEGQFVFRLSGRDRQRSASYYTPEVLTEFTVRHALDVLFGENPELRAADMLKLTICEPALGSGAFVNEAITQLAERYLKAAMDEAGQIIEADKYRLELQKAKAHFAVNQAYGVDLNQTAVELAEVSLWLGCMHKGLEAPWFGARLRRGNSLIGARRATYSREEVGAAAWTGKSPRPPTDRPPHETPFGQTSGIHHFLVPGQGWGAAADAPEIKVIDAEWVAAVAGWRSRMHEEPSATHLKRLGVLAARVEELWTLSAREVDGFWRATRHHIEVWGGPTAPVGTHFGDEDIRQVLSDPRSATSRLRALMDAWCSLWLWAPQHGTDLPTFDSWLTVVEQLLRIDEPWDSDRLFKDKSEMPAPTGNSIDDVAAAHTWFAHTRAIAREQGWFHWELEFSPVFAAGGFDLQLGNPPWVRPRWSDEDALAEHDPWFGVTSPIPQDQRVARRDAVLENEKATTQYLAERAENEALNDCLGAVTREHLLAGQQTNLYLLFITGSWRRSAKRGAIALIHPEGHLSDPKAGTLRAATYRHYRAHFHFINELKLFKEISDTREYGVHVYGGDRGSVEFLQAAFLYHPMVADRSIGHDGTGELPGRKLPTKEWDVRPHKERLVAVDADVLAAWAALLAYADAACTPIVKSVTSAEAAAAEAIARYPKRLGAVAYHWSPGFHEQTAPRRGLVEERTDLPPRWDEVMLQGPHIGISTPFAKQPRPSGQHQQDYEAWDLGTLPESVIPRTNWQRKASRKVFDAEIARWDGQPHTARYRVIARDMVASNTARSVFVSLLPPKANCMSVCYLGALSTDRDTTAFCGMMSGILADYFARTIGASHLHDNTIVRFPVVAESDPLVEPILHRTLRLNCLTREYADLWEALASSAWCEDDITDTSATISIASPSKTWSMSVPARADLDRWLLLCELDALGALVLGVTPSELGAVYRSQFPVLLGYEHAMLFDANGRQLCNDWHQYGYLQAQREAQAKTTKSKGWVKLWDRVQAHIGGDTTVDLCPFAPPFRPADREAAMTHAYWTFVDRYGLTPPGGAERPR